MDFSFPPPESGFYTRARTRNFPKQAELFEALGAELGDALVVAASCSPTSPGYKYFAIGAHRLPALLQTTAPGRRWFFELLRSQPVPAPSKLYLDVEFDRAANPEVALDDAGFGALVVAHTRAVVAWYLGWDAAAELDALAPFVELDASNAAKFSRHFVFDLRACDAPETRLMFADAASQQAFVHGHLLGYAPDLSGTRPPFPDALRVRAKGAALDAPRAAVAIDRAVYTSNRVFRMMLSAKASDPARVLLPLGAAGDPERLVDAAVAAVQNSTTGSDLFFRALVTYQPPSTRVTLLRLASSSSPHRVALASSSSMHRAVEPSAAPGVPEVWAPGVAALVTHIRETHDLLVTGVARPLRSDGVVHPLAARPFIGADLALDSRSRACTLRLKTARSTHASNHIRWQIDLGRRLYWQSCFDESCRATLRWLLEQSATVTLTPLAEQWALHRFPPSVVAALPADPLPLYVRKRRASERQGQPRKRARHE